MDCKICLKRDGELCTAYAKRIENAALMCEDEKGMKFDARKKDCIFFMKQRKCKALNGLYCEKGKCNFYKSKEKYFDD